MDQVEEFLGVLDQQVASSAQPQASTPPMSIQLSHGIHRDSFLDWKPEELKFLVHVVKSMEQYPKTTRPATASDFMVRRLP